MQNQFQQISAIELSANELMSNTKGLNKIVRIP